MYALDKSADWYRTMQAENRRAAGIENERGTVEVMVPTSPLEEFDVQLTLYAHGRFAETYTGNILAMPMITLGEEGIQSTTETMYFHVAQQGSRSGNWRHATGSHDIELFNIVQTGPPPDRPSPTRYRLHGVDHLIYEQSDAGPILLRLVTSSGPSAASR